MSNYRSRAIVTARLSNLRNGRYAAQTFADALTAAATGKATGTTMLTVVAFPMILGFSERSLTSFEQRVFGSSNKSRKG